MAEAPFAPSVHRNPVPDADGCPEAERIGRLAIRALYREVALSPKPGLVTPESSGSHPDMCYTTFLRSLQALRGYFPEITRLGARQASFETFQQAGIAAEARMLQATDGVNTHRGAIFNLGWLCAAVGVLARQKSPCTVEAVCTELHRRWGAAILETASSASNTHGAQVQRRYGYGGARFEAAAGFPTVRQLGLPVYRWASARTGSAERGAIQCLFALMAQLDDTNLLWRAGPEGLHFAKTQAREFLAAGGVLSLDWSARAQRIQREFVARHLSPGGSADLLGVTLFLDGL